MSEGGLSVLNEITWNVCIVRPTERAHMHACYRTEWTKRFASKPAEIPGALCFCYLTTLAGHPSAGTSKCAGKLLHRLPPAVSLKGCGVCTHFATWRKWWQNINVPKQLSVQTQLDWSTLIWCSLVSKYQWAVFQSLLKHIQKHTFAKLQGQHKFYIWPHTFHHIHLHAQLKRTYDKIHYCHFSDE